MRIVSYGKTFVDNVTVDTKLSNGQLGICTAYGTALPTTGRPEPFVIMSAIPTKDGGFMNQRGVDINPFNFTYNVRKYTEKDQKELIILKVLRNRHLSLLKVLYIMQMLSSVVLLKFVLLRSIVMV